MSIFKKILKWAGLVILGAYILLVIYRMFVLQGEKNTNEQVAKIHATKLSLDDVMGKNLPKDPGALADKTVQGVDANKNGIRDDVELAIFKEYPNSAKTRAVLLQYALVLQTQMTLPVVNKKTVTATVEDGDRAVHCIWSISSRSDMKRFDEETTKNEDFVKKLQINTEQRDKYQSDIYKNLGSYTSPGADGCDLSLSSLPN
ncbi:MAG: hypothetical protein Q7R64_02465 [bacterium]|nr:hypothetical protein [bacterium]